MSDLRSRSVRCPGLLALAAALWAVAPTAARAQRAGPKLVCPQMTWEFGVVTNREIVRHGFALRNEGDMDLVVESVRTGCGCTTTKLSSNRIRPGEAATLDVELSLKDRQGPQSKPVYVHSNDPVNPRMLLQMVGEIRRDVESEPLHLSFGYVESERDATQAVRFVSGTGRPFHVTGVDTEHATFFTPSLEERKAGQEYVVTARLTEEGRRPGANHRGRMIVRTDNPRYAQLEVPIIVFQPKEIMVSPQEIVLEAGGGGYVPLTRYLLIRSPLQKRFSIVAVEKPHAEIEVKQERISDTRYRLTLSNLRARPELNGKILKVRLNVEPNGVERVVAVPILVQ